MSIQKDIPLELKEAAELAAIQRNAVTVPADKLAELQRKAKLANELIEINKDLLEQIYAQERLIDKLFELGAKGE
mgnify:CR=1 FL=1